MHNYRPGCSLNIGILHPGEMGSSIGGALVAAGHRVLWVSRGRSEVSANRAREDGLESCNTLAEFVVLADVVLAVCPPHAAVELSQLAMAAGFDGIYVDANAVAPDTVGRIESVVAPGADFVDGGIIGPPARVPGSTRLYLSGARAPEIAALFDGSLLETHTIDAVPGRASALKMCYAAWTKGSAALLLAVAGLARAEGVENVLRQEWNKSQPQLPAKLETTVRSSVPKAWRFSSEMLEIAGTFDSSGLPDGFHQAAADIYGRLSDFKDGTSLETDDVLNALCK